METLAKRSMRKRDTGHMNSGGDILLFAGKKQNVPKFNAAIM